MKYLYILILIIIPFSEIFSLDIVAFSDFNHKLLQKEASVISKNKIIEKHIYRVDGLKDENEKMLINIEYFNEKGLLTKLETIGVNNKVNLTAHYKYDSENRIIEVKEVDDFRALLMLQNFTYDSLDRLAKVKSSGFNDVLLHNIEYTYIEEKSIAIEKFRDSNNAVVEYRIHLYNKPFDKIIKTSVFKTDNEINGITAFFYNDFNLAAKEVYRTDITEPYQIKYHYIYDENQKLIESKSLTYPDKLLVTVKNSYDDRNMLESNTMFDANGNKITTLFNEYVIK